MHPIHASSFLLLVFSSLGIWCEAKPTTLKRPSPGDGLENHMCCVYLENAPSHPKALMSF